MIKRRLKERLTFEGVGIHTGEFSKIELLPNEKGIIVEKNKKEIKITPCIIDTKNATNVKVEDVELLTVEHLFSALYSLRVFDVRIRIIEGKEVPIFDGSSKVYFEALKNFVEDHDEIEPFKISEPIKVFDADSKIYAEPFESKLIVEYKIYYDHPKIREMKASFEINESVFEKEIAPARTFGFFKDYERLLKFNLAGGASAENTIILGEKDIINPPLRFNDEFVRHKILDFLGDLHTVGKPVEGKIKIEYGGHHIHNLFAREIYLKLQDKTDQ